MAKIVSMALTLLLLYLTFTTPIQYYSSELVTKTTTVNSTIRTDFIKNNIITFAVDKGYATVIKNPSLEEYFDEKGNPVMLPAGYSRIWKSSGLITYLDTEFNPVVINNGYDSIHRTYTEDGQADTDTYYVGFEQVETSAGYWGYKREYDGEKVTEIQYLDKDGGLTLNSNGYAIIKRSYTDSGRTDMYFGVDGEPVAASLGQYGVYKKYDSEGRTILTTYLDVYGKPLNTTYGYAIIKTSYEKGLTQQFFNADGQPSTIGSNQYGTQIKNGQKIYLDEYGKPIIRLDGFLHRNLVLVAVIGLLISILALVVKERGRHVLITMYIGFIVLMTLYYRDARDSRGQLDIFWSYRQFFSSVSLRGEILKNIWLFVPLGAAMSGWKHGWLWAISLSVVIEVVQFVTGLGLFELDDLISNGIGSVLGFGFGFVMQPLMKRFKLNMRI